MNILWLKTELLHPVDKGGKIRSYNMLKALKRDCRITYLTLDDGTADQSARDLASEYCHDLVCVPHRRREKFTTGFYVELALNLASDLPYAIKKYESPEMREEIKRLLAAQRIDVLVCDFLAPAVNVPPNLNCTTVLFQHNVEAMIWKRHYEVQSAATRKAYLYRQWQKMRAFEAKACKLYDSVIAVSREDREQMQQEYGLENVFDIPTGVDTEYFRPSGKVATRPHHLVFTGSMDWLPNEDGMTYFVHEILPRVRQAQPGATLSIIGRSPTPAVRRLAEEAGVEVTGRVDDVRPHVAQGSVYVVPLRIGGGTRLKIFEAMAMAKAVVSTTIGAEGLPVTNGRDILIADDPAAFADAVVRLIRNKTERQALEAAARRLVVERYDWSAVAGDFEEALSRVCGAARVAAPMTADSELLTSNS